MSPKSMTQALELSPLWIQVYDLRPPWFLDGLQAPPQLRPPWIPNRVLTKCGLYGYLAVVMDFHHPKHHHLLP